MNVLLAFRRRRNFSYNAVRIRDDVQPIAYLVIFVVNRNTSERDSCYAWITQNKPPEMLFTNLSLWLPGTPSNIAHRLFMIMISLAYRI